MEQQWPNEQPIDEYNREIFDDAQHWPLYRRSVALIGSYHAPFLDEMRRAASVFRDHDIRIVHPTGFIPETSWLILLYINTILLFLIYLCKEKLTTEWNLRRQC